MRKLLLIALLSLPMLDAFAEPNMVAEVQLPIAFSYQYTPEVNIVLTPERCNKDDPTFGFVAEAHSTTGQHAYGCWRYAENETVQLWLSPAPDVFIDLVLYKSKFKPVYPV